MTHIVGAMASLHALRGSLGEPALRPNPVAQPPAVLRPLDSQATVSRIGRLPVVPRKEGDAWARS